VIAAPHASNSTTTTTTSQGSSSPPSHHWTTSSTCNTRSRNAAVVDGDENHFLHPCLGSSIDAAPSTVVRLSTGRTSANPRTISAIVGRQHQCGHRRLDQKLFLLQPVRPPKWHHVYTTRKSGSTEHFVPVVTTVAQVSAFYSSVRPPSSIWSHEHG
jgi:hypothetical protein